MQSIDHVVYLNMFLRGFLIRVETNVLQRTGTRTGISAATRANLKKARWGNGESNVKKTNGIAPPVLRQTANVQVTSLRKALPAKRWANELRVLQLFLMALFLSV
ncbi:hypothetical protein GV819_10295 [Pseudomonas sp. Fl5BN2]|uniref:hypothetical protein n=1 Tax=Pseudomonas sp. Fl5BN2 TaxID=2697652 RepID=UPI00137771A1|nr:hypothetical protein [Pseudomonas sp. Fl5BN2]NBF02677.1 hypothetical protein [Pseudomonas sp. Fl5BN2]